MKFLSLLLCAAICQFGHATLQAQQLSNDVKGEVTEFSQFDPIAKDNTDQATSAAVQQYSSVKYDSEERLKIKNRDTADASTQAPYKQATNAVLSENTNEFPGSEANVSPNNQRYAPSGPNQRQSVNSFELIETAKANTQAPTPQQLKASRRLAKANAKAALVQAKRDAAKAAAFIPNNSVYGGSDLRLYGQFGVQDQRVGGLNLMLASQYFPSIGSYAYQAELGVLKQLSSENSLDAGLRYGLLNGLEKAQRVNRPSTGLYTDLTSTMWLVGVQTGVDHDLLGENDWNVCVGLGLGFDVGGLHLTQRVQEITTTQPVDPSIPTPDEVAEVHYNLINTSISPRLTVRSPQLANGMQIQARIGYQFGQNNLLRVKNFDAIHQDALYNPTGLTANIGFTAPLTNLRCK